MLGSGDIALTVTGSGFQQDTVVLWDGAPLATTYVDGGTLQATVPASLIDSAGAYDVQVAPGAAPPLASMPLPFAVYNPQAAISSLSPDAAPMEGDGFTLTVNGSGFVDGATVLWNGEARPTTFVSSTRLQATISAEDLAAARPVVSVTVANPDPSAGISDAVTFNILRGGFQLYLPVIIRTK